MVLTRAPRLELPVDLVTTLEDCSINNNNNNNSSSITNLEKRLYLVHLHDLCSCIYSYTLLITRL